MITGIVGLGLIGGSMAKAYKANSDATVLGMDTDAPTLHIAKIYGAVDEELTDENIAKCDLILLCVNTESAINFVKEKAPVIDSHTIVVDCCGIKRKICEACFPIAKEHGFTFVGGHPMAGTHHSGFKSSTEDLYRDEAMVIVPPVFDDIKLLTKVEELLEPCRFGTFNVTTAEDHDELIAFTSQMAHVVSNGYIKSPSAPKHKGISAGSYKDLTRVAWLNPEMWAELFLGNQENILNEIDWFIESMKEYRTAIADGNYEELCRLLDEGRIRKKEIDN